MTNHDKELIGLRRLAPKGELWTDGGLIIAFLPDVNFFCNGGRVTCDLLLWPYERDGYQSRLFLSAQIVAPQANNWNIFQIQGRQWHACSWQGVPNTLPWVEILANHLGAFK